MVAAIYLMNVTRPAPRSLISYSSTKEFGEVKIRKVVWDEDCRAIIVASGIVDEGFGTAHVWESYRTYISKIAAYYNQTLDHSGPKLL